MKRLDRVVVPDSYDRYEQMKRDRAWKQRVEQLETRVKQIEKLLQDKYAD